MTPLFCCVTSLTIHGITCVVYLRSISIEPRYCKLKASDTSISALHSWESLLVLVASSSPVPSMLIIGRQSIVISGTWELPASFPAMLIESLLVCTQYRWQFFWLTLVNNSLLLPFTFETKYSSSRIIYRSTYYSNVKLEFQSNLNRPESSQVNMSAVCFAKNLAVQMATSVLL